MRFLDFLRPGWKHSDPSVRTAAVEKITEQFVLGEIVRTDSDFEVRRAAAKRLADAAEVEKIKFKDQALLAIIAEGAIGRDARKAAVEKLYDLELVSQIAKNDADEYVRATAVAKLTDQALLAEIARLDRSRVVSELAADRLTDPAVLIQIANNRDLPEGTRAVAVKKLRERHGARPAIAVSGITASVDLQMIRTYVRHLASEWWKDQDESREHAVCDACNGPVQRDSGYLMGTWLRCEQCGDRWFAPGNETTLRDNPDFYGRGVLEKARTFDRR